MSKNLELIERLLDVLEHSALVEIDYVLKDERIYLQKSCRRREASREAVPSREESVGEDLRPPSTGKSDFLYSVKAGFAGAFHRAPSPDQASFVEVGAQVKRGQTLAIVEAMKMLNEIEADRDGVVVEICASNGDVVQPGTPLFVLRSEGPHHV